MKENRMNLPSFYSQMTGDLVQNGCGVVARFSDKRIADWKSYVDGDGSTVSLRFDLTKGIVLRDDKKEVGLALGWGKGESRYDERYLRLQFGVQPNSGEIKDFRDVRNLQSLVKGCFINFGTGEFYDDGFQIRPNCWSNSGIYGGRGLTEVDEISAWEIFNRFLQHGFTTDLR